MIVEIVGPEGRVVHVPEADEEAVEVPLLGVLALEPALDDRRDDLLDHLLHLLAEVLALDDALALVVDDAPLLVHDLVVLEHVLAAHEVELLDLLLGALDDPGEHLVLDRQTLLRPQPIEHLVHAVAGEETDEVVLGREVEAALAGVALTPRAAAQLVVDAPALVALGAQHVEAAELGHARPELDVDAAAGHVGGDGHRAGKPGVLDDLGLALVLLGVEDVVLDAVPLEHAREHLADLDRHRADEHRLAVLVALLDVVHDGRELLLLGLEDEVVLVAADHGHVGRDLHDIEAVDRAELVLLGLGRTGHAGELLVEAEVVLQRDRGQGLVLFADGHALLGLDRLMQALGVAAPLEDAPRELVDDQHLAVLHHVLDVLVVERLGAQRLHEMVDELPVLVEVVDVERLLDLGHAGLGDGRGALLLVDLVVFARTKPGDDARELTVRVGRRLRRAADDERRARLVDEDGVDLVDDAVVMPALHAVVEAHRHVVAQVVEAELGVGAVGQVGAVGLLARRRVHHRLDQPDARGRGTRRSAPSTRSRAWRGSR